MNRAGFLAIALSVVWGCAQAGAPGRAEERAVVFPVGSAALTPRLQGAMQALAQEIGEDAQVTVIGRDDDGSPQGLGEARARILGAALRAAGIARANITFQYEPLSAPNPAQGAPSHIRWVSGPASASATPMAMGAPAAGMPAEPSRRATEADRFAILAADGDLAATLRRWGDERGYQILWEAPVSVPVTGELTLDARDIHEAVGQVLFGLHKAGYPALQARQYPDKLIRITAVSH